MERANPAKKPNIPSDKKYRKYIGKYLRYVYNGSYICSKITGIKLQTDTLHGHAKTNRKGNYHFFTIEDETDISHYYKIQNFGCKQTKRRLARGEYQLIESENVETVRILDKIN